MKIPVEINQNCVVSIEIEDVISEINNLPLSQRMNYVAVILNKIETENSEIIDIHRDMILNYLQKQAIVFQNKNH